MVRYSGHFGENTEAVDKHSLKTYIADAERTLNEIEEVIGKNEPVFGIGASLGCPLIRTLAETHPESFCGILLFASPMMGGMPVWKTLWTILANRNYRGPIFSRTGTIRLKRKDAEDFLFGGSHRMTDEVCMIPESGRVIFEALFGKMRPNTNPNLLCTVVGAHAEKFHSNSAKREWAYRGKSTSYVEVPGHHFTALMKAGFHELAAERITTAFKAWDKRKRESDGPETKIIPTHQPEEKKSEGTPRYFSAVEA